MRTRGRLLQVLDKAETGPIVKEKEFDTEYIQKPIAELVKKYDIQWKKGVMVPSDDALADRVFEAGLELVLNTGAYCLDTRRRMVFTRDEIDEVLFETPAEVTLGAGDDAVTIRHRKPDENSRVTVCGGAYGIPVPEDQFAARTGHERRVRAALLLAAGHRSDAYEARRVARPGGAEVDQRVAVHVAAEVDVPRRVEFHGDVVVTVPAETRRQDGETPLARTEMPRCMETRRRGCSTSPRWTGAVPARVPPAARWRRGTGANPGR